MSKVTVEDVVQVAALLGHNLTIKQVARVVEIFPVGYEGTNIAEFNSVIEQYIDMVLSEEPTVVAAPTISVQLKRQGSHGLAVFVNEIELLYLHNADLSFVQMDSTISIRDDNGDSIGFFTDGCDDNGNQVLDFEDVNNEFGLF